MFCSIKNVKALLYGGCEYSVVSNLKSLVSNVNISYTYEIRNNDAYFNVTLNKIPKDVYFIDTKTNAKYYYSDTADGEITIKEYNNVTDGQYRFMIYNGICDGVKLGTKYYKFPKYNKIYNSEICKGIENYSLCKKWSKDNYSDDEKINKIKEYKSSEKEDVEKSEIKYEKDTISKIVEFYIKYYYLFLPIIIFICVIIMFISRKKNSFKL